MGVAGSISHFLIKTAMNALVMFALLVVLLEISPSKIPMLLLISFISGIVSSIIASFLLVKARGY
jgi:putative flippase GtrA